MNAPPILEEIRRVRHAISSEIGHDPAKIVDYFASIQKRHADRVINLAEQQPNRRTKHCIEVADRSLPDGGSTSATR
jgi:hypothetical protein